jgi:hypothetical protein
MCGSKESEGYGRGGNSNGIINPLFILFKMSKNQSALMMGKNQVFGLGWQSIGLKFIKTLLETWR